MIRAHIADNFSAFGVAVSIVRHSDDDRVRQVMHFVRHGDGESGEVWTRWDDYEPGTAVPPTFTLGHDEANALLAALHNHYQGVDDQRKLRQDYDAERGRVDKLIAVVSDIARHGAGG
jgi:hypothetical protein